MNAPALAGSQRLLDHRMASAANLERLTVVDKRPRVALVPRQLGERGRGVELGERGSNAPQALLLHLDRRSQLGKDLLLEAQGALGSRGDAPLDVDQLGGRKTNGIGHRLPMPELIRQRRLQQRLGIALRHLDEVAEDVVVAHLQRFDTGALDVAGLEPGHHAAPVLLEAARFVELGPVALAHETAVALQMRRIVDERRRQSIGERRIDCTQIA